ncbi:MAG: hypothetical protein C4548_07615 [Desulfobacteraceae bacterium]|nr:MAG: hypothetical protein C4548_07615 [Desulfobacteraceae bacterium]
MPINGKKADVQRRPFFLMRSREDILTVLSISEGFRIISLTNRIRNNKNFPLKCGNLNGKHFDIV